MGQAHMPERDPEINDSVYIPRQDPESYAYMYNLPQPWGWKERRPNGIIREINGDDEVFVDYYNGDFNTHELYEFKKYENHMWVLE